MTTKAPNPTLEAFEPAACFRASHSVEQTATLGVWTKLAFDTPLINVGSHYDNARGSQSDA